MRRAVNRLETPSGKVFAVGALVARRAVAGFRQDVLLDDDPAAVRLAHLVEHRVDVEVALAQAAERLSPPDLGDRGRLAHDVLDHRAPRVFQMEMVDPSPPRPDRYRRVAAAEEEMAGVKAEPDRSQLEHLLDLPRRLDPRARLVVEGRL